MVANLAKKRSIKLLDLFFITIVNLLIICLLNLIIGAFLYYPSQS